MHNKIYLDYMSTTPTLPSVNEAIVRFLNDPLSYGNSSSRHDFGRSAAHAIELAQEQVAQLIGASAREIVWTSGATESNNMAILGAARFHRRSGNHIITVKTEHAAVLAPCRQLESEGFDVTYLNVDSNGVIDYQELRDAFTDQTILVSVMHVNNETGVIQDIDSIASLVKQHGALFHVDAAQSIGKVEIDLATTPIDLLSMSAHKIYGPKGIGALFIRQEPKVRIFPLVFGSAQQRGLRAGTLPTGLIVGMGEALNRARIDWEKNHKHIEHCASLFLDTMLNIPGVELNAASALRYPGCVNLKISGLDIETLISSCPSLAFSQGAACSSAGASVSHVLESMNMKRQDIIQCVRISFGVMTTKKEVKLTVAQLSKNIAKLRRKNG